jgi:hypothetical protein
MRFETDVPPELPGNGDPRKLTFMIRGLKEIRFTTDSGSAKQPPFLPAEDSIEFSQGRSGTNYLLEGLSKPSSRGVWPDGPEVSIKVPINGNAKDINMLTG